MKTEYRTIYQRDSVYVDCTDTLYIFQRGDTVTIREKVTEREYHFQVLRDTMYRTDTVKVEKVTLAASDCPKKKVWPWFVAGFAIGIFFIFAVRIILKIYLKK